MNALYFTARIIRKLTPNWVTSFLLSSDMLIKPGWGTGGPDELANKYFNFLKPYNVTIKGKTILEFGYGGSFGTALAFLKKGAKHVFLIDKYSNPNNKRNSMLLNQLEADNFFNKTNNTIEPNRDFITFIKGDITENKVKEIIKNVDIIFSASVMEHIHDVGITINALKNIMASDGCQLHIIDIRDHFFKYPFEMLCYSERIWNTFLNPKESLNRLRIPQYRNIFKKYFNTVNINIFMSSLGQFKKAKARIRSEFISGNETEDSALMISLFARN